MEQEIITKFAKKSIECTINNGLSIRLENVQEIRGHDDSLPFDTDIFIFNSEYEETCFKKVGTAFNDGWGGLTQIGAYDSKGEKLLNNLDKYLQEHFEIVCDNNTKWDVTLEYLVSSMACYCIDKNIDNFNIKQMGFCKLKK